MAANVVNMEATDSGTMQGSGNPPAGGMPVPPGAVYPYLLPQGDVEKPFEPISLFAIKESGESRLYGPLNEEELKTFLRDKLDKGIVCSRDVIQRYTEDVYGLSQQLTNLRNRIHQIKASEKERTDYIKSRIRDFEKALRECKPLPVYIPHQLNLSNAAREAFEDIGSRGPLEGTQLFNFIHTGVYDKEIPTNEIIKQLNYLRLRINDNYDIEQHQAKFYYGKVLKALNDIITEMMYVNAVPFSP